MSLLRSPAFLQRPLPPLPRLTFTDIQTKLGPLQLMDGNPIEEDNLALTLPPHLQYFAANSPHSAVLILLIGENEFPAQVLFTTRTQRLSTHAGQVSFPGGRRDAKDRSLVATALRETSEEIGLPTTAVEVLGALTALYSHSGYLITPIVGRVAALPPLQLNPHEVDHAFTVPFEVLLNPQNHGYHHLSRPRNHPRNHLHTHLRATPPPEKNAINDSLADTVMYSHTYSIPYAGFDVWGLSALIVRRLYGRLYLH